MEFIKVGCFSTESSTLKLPTTIEVYTWDTVCKTSVMFMRLVIQKLGYIMMVSFATVSILCRYSAVHVFLSDIHPEKWLAGLPLTARQK